MNTKLDSLKLNLGFIGQGYNTSTNQVVLIFTHKQMLSADIQSMFCY